MNASQAALVNKFASEPLEQSEMWVGDHVLSKFQAIISFIFRSHTILAWKRLQSWCAIWGTMVSSGKIHNSKRSKNYLSSIIRDEHADFKDEMARLRQLRGKVKMRYDFFNFWAFHCPTKGQRNPLKPPQPWQCSWGGRGYGVVNCQTPKKYMTCHFLKCTIAVLFLKLLFYVKWFWNTPPLSTFEGVEQDVANV